MTQAAHSTQVITEEDQLRADLYDFLSALLARPANKALLDKTAKLSGDETDLGRAIGTLAKLAVQSSVKSVEREFNALFIGLGRGELLPYGSYYMTGFLNEKPLALLRDDMAKNRIVRAENIYEPEDNIASVLEMMSGLIMGRFGEVVSLSQQKTFFNRHIAPWAWHFFTYLEGAEGSLFFAPIGAIGRHFMAIEKEAFRITAD